MVREQVLQVREHSRESLLEKVKSESNQNKLTFNTTYYLVFQNVRNFLQELRILPRRFYLTGDMTNLYPFSQGWLE